MEPKLEQASSLSPRILGESSPLDTSFQAFESIERRVMNFTFEAHTEDPVILQELTDCLNEDLYLLRDAVIRPLQATRAECILQLSYSDDHDVHGWDAWGDRLTDKPALDAIRVDILYRAVIPELDSWISAFEPLLESARSHQTKLEMLQDTYEEGEERLIENGKDHLSGWCGLWSGNALHAESEGKQFRYSGEVELQIEIQDNSFGRSGLIPLTWLSKWTAVTPELFDLEGERMARWSDELRSAGVSSMFRDFEPAALVALGRKLSVLSEIQSIADELHPGISNRESNHFQRKLFDHLAISDLLEGEVVMDKGILRWVATDPTELVSSLLEIEQAAQRVFADSFWSPDVTPVDPEVCRQVLSDLSRWRFLSCASSTLTQGADGNEVICFTRDGSPDEQGGYFLFDVYFDREGAETQMVGAKLNAVMPGESGNTELIPNSFASHALAAVLLTYADAARTASV